MNKQLIEQINQFSTYRYDPLSGRIVNLQQGKLSDIEAFLELQHILDSNKVAYKFEENFQIHIIGQ